MLPLFPPPTETIATCGIELTVSVSMVMFCMEPSPDGFPRPADVFELYLVTGGRVTVTGGGFVGFIFMELLPPLSLPLSLFDLGFVAFPIALSTCSWVKP